MILRPRQKRFVDACVKALKSEGNTLGVAPTGAGKTVMLSAATGAFDGATTIVLQHRTELVQQNERTFRRVNPKRRTSFYTADYKVWGAEGQATFGMIQTVALDKNLCTMPPCDLMVIDEAHHAASDSYIKVIDHARDLNPKMMLLGVTATPQRGDARNLRAAWDNVADQITIGELIRDGHLVKPRAFVIDTDTQSELAGVRKLTTDFDMSEVESIMNTRPINAKVVEKWREHARQRRTVVFASTIKHAIDVNREFVENGIAARVVHGDMTPLERRECLADFDRGAFQVIVNVMVLTEGWDCPPVDCVVLLRPCSFKSTMIQMIGRGLRTVDPERYPGVVKDDCIVLDFGYSMLTHKGIEQAPSLDTDEGPKDCPACSARVPSAVSECPVCGFDWPVQAADDEADAKGPGVAEPVVPLAEFVMTEIDLLAKSPFRWEAFFDGVVTIANGLSAWAAVVNYKGRWVAVGGAREAGMRVVADCGDRLMAMAAADDFMRDFGDDDTARKSKSWLRSPPTAKQMEFLGLPPFGAMGLNRYRASCAIQWQIMERAIRNKLMRLSVPADAMAA